MPSKDGPSRDAFTFSRLKDMFRFFRGEEINPSYWAEKLVSTEVRLGHTRFDDDYYRHAIKEDFKFWKFKDRSQKKRAWQDIEQELFEELDTSHNGAHAIRKAIEYQCAETRQSFTDFWDHNFEKPSSGFIWACRAIQWGIGQYDLEMDLRKEQTAAPIAEDDGPSL